MTEHLKLEIAATMAYEWVHKYLEYCESVQTMHVIEHAIGKTVNDDALQSSKAELLESSNAIMALSAAMDFQLVNVQFPCLHRRMFYLGIAFITNSQVMETCQDDIHENPDDINKKNYLYIVNEEQHCIHEELDGIHQYLTEKENENDSETQTQSEGSET